MAYHLGPDIPIGVIRTKGTFASGRVWVLLDQLLTHDNLAEAARASRALTAGRFPEASESVESLSVESL